MELNASFYRIPKSSVSEGWYRRTPENFRFAVKVSRLVTHVHRLKDCKDSLEWFFENMAPLKEKASVFLLQLPPSLVPDRGLLREFTGLLPAGRYVFEFRNKECYDQPFVDVLREVGIGFCIHDFPGRESPLWVTSDFAYIRFHGYKQRYGGDYPEDELEKWAEQIGAWVDEGLDVFAYFNNDAEGNAVKNALFLRNLLKDMLKNS